MENQQLVVQDSLKPIDKNGNVTLANLSDTQLQNCTTLSKQLNEGDANSIINFGSEIQNSVAKQSDTFLNSVRTYNSGEVGTLITDLLTEINYIDVDQLDQSLFKKTISKIPFLGKLVKGAEKMFQEYDKVTSNVEKISNKVKAGMINSAKDNSSLQTMFDGNVSLIKDLENYIIKIIKSQTNEILQAGSIND